MSASAGLSTGNDGDDDDVEFIVEVKAATPKQGPVAKATSSTSQNVAAKKITKTVSGPNPAAARAKVSAPGKKAGAVTKKKVFGGLKSFANPDFGRRSERNGLLGPVPFVKPIGPFGNPMMRPDNYGWQRPLECFRDSWIGPGFFDDNDRRASFDNFEGCPRNFDDDRRASFDNFEDRPRNFNDDDHRASFENFEGRPRNFGERVSGPLLRKPRHIKPNVFPLAAKFQQTDVMAGPFSCLVCDRNFKLLESYNQHVSSDGHKRKANIAIETRNDKPSNSVNDGNKTCKLSTTAEPVLESGPELSRRQRKLQEHLKRTANDEKNRTLTDPNLPCDPDTRPNLKLSDETTCAGILKKKLRRKSMIQSIKVAMKRELAIHCTEGNTLKPDQESEFWKLKGFQNLIDYKYFALCGVVPPEYIPSSLSNYCTEFPEAFALWKASSIDYFDAKDKTTTRLNDIQCTGFRCFEDFQDYMLRSILPTSYQPKWLIPPLRWMARKQQDAPSFETEAPAGSSSANKSVTPTTNSFSTTGTTLGSSIASVSVSGSSTLPGNTTLGASKQLNAPRTNSLADPKAVGIPLASSSTASVNSTTNSLSTTGTTLGSRVAGSLTLLGNKTLGSSKQPNVPRTSSLVGPKAVDIPLASSATASVTPTTNSFTTTGTTLSSSIASVRVSGSSAFPGNTTLGASRQLNAPRTNTLAVPIAFDIPLVKIKREKLDDDDVAGAKRPKLSGVILNPLSTRYLKPPVSDTRKKYCSLCETRFAGSTVDHRRSIQHKNNLALSRPVCADCKQEFSSTASYWTHCSTVHQKAATITFSVVETETKQHDPRVEEGDVDADVEFDERFFLDLAADSADVPNDCYLDSDESVCEISNDEEEPETVEIVDLVADISKPPIEPSKLVRPQLGVSPRRQPREGMPDYVVPAHYCKLCSVFFHDEDSVIEVHFKSKTHLANLK